MSINIQESNGWDLLSVGHCLKRGIRHGNIRLAILEGSFFVDDFTELMPVSGRMLSKNIFIWKNSNKHVLNWEFEIIEEQIEIGLIHGLFLSSVNSNKIEANSLNI